MPVRCHALLTVPFLVCLFSGVQGGCDRTSAPPPTVSRGPVFEFYDGERPLPPSQWANLPVPDEGDGAAHISSLHIREVLRKAARSDRLDPLTAHPEWDPTEYIFEDLPTIERMGRSSSFSLEWTGAEHGRDEPGWNEYFVLPDGSRLLGPRFGMYINTLTQVAVQRSDQLSRDELLGLSDSLLWIGYNIYNSDSEVASANARHVILLSAWAAAITLRQHDAQVNDDVEALELWTTRLDEWYEAHRDMSRRRRIVHEHYYGPM